MEFRLLKADEIEVKIKQVFKEGAAALIYKTARTDMQLLDETVGSMFWQSDYKVVKDNLYCGIGILDKERLEWVWKWDCGTESRDDGEGNEKKGEASDAFKRAGFKVGIGRELYSAPRLIFLKVDTKEDGKDKWNNPKYKLKNKYEQYSVKEVTYNDKKEIENLIIINSKGKVVFSKTSNSNDYIAKKTKEPEKSKGEEKTAKIVDRLGLIENLMKAGSKIEKVCKFFGKPQNELTDDMIIKFTEGALGNLNIHQLEEYRDSLN